jgi:hypothetical protein
VRRVRDISAPARGTCRSSTEPLSSSPTAAEACAISPVDGLTAHVVTRTMHLHGGLPSSAPNSLNLTARRLVRNLLL